MACPGVHVDDEAEGVVEAFCQYELVERRLAEVSVHNASYRVRQFLAWRAATGRGPLKLLEPGELAEFIVDEAGRLARGSMAAVVATLRSFARFLFATGVTGRDLSVFVPPVARDRFDGLPKFLDGETVNALLGSCDLRRPCGRRDYAILLFMVRLGLRAVEVTRLQFADIDWRAGEIEVHGKGGRRDRLPLPTDVGEALADYLRWGRPPSSVRAVFLAIRNPATAMSAHSASLITQTACQRLGIRAIGGHRLRHTTATNLLGSGATLREVAEVLRQGDAVTTAQYARVDHGSLQLVVSPWPRAGS